MTSPADELRQAARHIRAVAAKATPGPWLNLDGDRVIRDPDATAREDDSDPCGSGPPLEYVVDEPLYANPANGNQFVLWDPPTALFVADELEQRARPLDTIDANAQRFLMGDREGATLDPILALARAVNTKQATEDN